MKSENNYRTESDYGIARLKIVIIFYGNNHRHHTAVGFNIAPYIRELFYGFEYYSKLKMVI